MQDVNPHIQAAHSSPTRIKEKQNKNKKPYLGTAKSTCYKIENLESSSHNEKDILDSVKKKIDAVK